MQFQPLLTVLRRVAALQTSTTLLHSNQQRVSTASQSCKLAASTTVLHTTVYILPACLLYITVYLTTYSMCSLACCISQSRLLSAALTTVRTQVVQVVGHALQQATAKEHKLVVASGGGSALCRVNFCLRHNTAYRPHEVYAAVGIDEKVRDPDVDPDVYHRLMYLYGAVVLVLCAAWRKYRVLCRHAQCACVYMIQQ
jgi:hypothetical protein